MKNLINREAVVERSIMITMTARDTEMCIENFELYSAATRVLEHNSGGYTIGGFPSSTLDRLGRGITLAWCNVEAIRSPFTESDLRKAVADAMRLAKKELKDEYLTSMQEMWMSHKLDKESQDAR